MFSNKRKPLLLTSAQEAKSAAGSAGQLSQLAII